MECADVENFLDYDFKFHYINDFRIKVKDKSFDIAMINDTLHHIPYTKQIKLIREAQRVSKKTLIFESDGVVAEAMDVYFNKGKMGTSLSFRSLQSWINILYKEFYQYEIKIPFYYPQKQYCFIQI